MAIFYLKCDDENNFLKKINKLLAKSNDVNALLLKGKFYFDWKELDQASKLFLKVIKIQKSNLEAINLYLNCNINLYRFKENI